jgi:outer membrane protein assembly factor BamB
MLNFSTVAQGVLRMIRQTILGVVAWSIAAQMLAADFEQEKLQNWHQFRGPLATGVAPNGNPPTEWNDGKNIKWKIELPGRGSASPIVWGDRIYILTAIKTDRTNEAPEAEAAALPTKARFVSTESTTLLAQQNENNNERPQGGERNRDGERRGRGGFGGGGFGRGGFGIEKPKNYHQYVVLCIDRNTGDTIWQKTAIEDVPHEGHHQTGSFASGSPVTDGTRLIASFGSRGIFCYDMDGNRKWQKDLGDMRTRFSFGEGASPALYKDTIVVTWDHEDEDFIVALDANTGNELWRQQRDEPTTWATPLIVEAAGKTQVITSGENRIRSYDFETGELIWECGGLGSNPIACPVTYEGLAIAMSGHRDPAGIAIPLNVHGDVTDTDKVKWKIDEVTPYVSSPVLYDDTLYFTKSRNAILTSANAKTGELIINSKRLPDMDSIYSSPVAAAGRVYWCSREGTTVVTKHGPEFEVLATNTIDEAIDATPAIVGNDLIIRGEKNLYCISEN